jgi:branched-chain amino acid transport system permease protein
VISGGAFTRATTAIIQQIGIYIILAVSLNMVTGYLGQLPLGHAGFMAVGAYVAALVWKSTLACPRAEHILGVLAAGLAAAVFGVIIGIPALRLKGDYLAIITLGFGEIIRICIINLKDITGGTPGLLNIPKYSSFFVIFLAVAVTCYVVHTIMHSRHGRAILSIRENEIAADACGINLTYYKVFTFAVSAFFAGIAGTLYAGFQGSLFPKSVAFMASINILVRWCLAAWAPCWAPRSPRRADACRNSCADSRATA